MPAEDPLASLLLVISIGGAIAVVLKRLGLGSVAGYLVGGLLGSLLGVRQDVGSLIAQIGIVLLGFEIGAEIGGRLSRGVLGIAAGVEAISMTLVYIATGIISMAAGLGLAGQILLFLISINTSTGVLFKLLQGRADETTRALLITASTIEDVVAVSGLALIHLLAEGEAGPLNIVAEIGRIGFVSLAMLGLGIYVFKLLGRRLRDVEMLPILALSTALFYWLAAGWAGVSQLLGAFIAGLALSRTVDLSRAVPQLAGLRELGLLLYFSSLGAYLKSSGLENPSQILLFLGMALLVIAIKLLSFSTALRIAGLGSSEAVRSGLYMTSVSELGIIVAFQAAASGVASHLYQVLSIYLVFFSAIISSLAVRFSGQIAAALPRIFPERAEKWFEDFVSGTRQQIASQGLRELRPFAVALAAMILTLGFTEAMIDYAASLPEGLAYYALVVALTASTIIMVAPVAAARRYAKALRSPGPALGIRRIVAANIFAGELLLGALFEAYVVNKAVSQYAEQLLLGLHGHIIATLALAAATAYIVRKGFSSMYRTAGEIGKGSEDREG